MIKIDTVVRLLSTTWISVTLNLQNITRFTGSFNFR